MSVYLDYSASAPVLPEVLETMIDAYRNTPGNAGSRTHAFGTSAAKLVSRSRETIAAVLGRDPSEVIFTSGSTESNNTAILGIRDFAQRTGRNHIITTAIEHKSVLEPLRFLESLGFSVDFVRPDESGRVSARDILGRVTERTCLVSVMSVNSETGIIQPVDEIGEELRRRHVLFHVDATQAFGKLSDEIRHLHYDLMSVSAHKIGGPQGIGALVRRRNEGYENSPLAQLMYGGMQERGFRPGTVPVALAAGFAKAAEISEREHEARARRCARIKRKFLEAISCLRYDVNGDQRYCLPSSINVSIDGLDAEAAFLCLRDEYAFSNGSACNASSHQLSYVLDAMGLSEKRKSEAIRLSWGGDVDVDFGRFVSIVKQVI